MVVVNPYMDVEDLYIDVENLCIDVDLHEDLANPSMDLEQLYMNIDNPCEDRIWMPETYDELENPYEENVGSQRGIYIYVYVYKRNQILDSFYLRTSYNS